MSRLWAERRDELWFDSWLGQEIFLFYKVSRLVWGGPIQPAIDWVPVIKQLVWSEAYHLPPCNAEVQNA